MLRPMPFVKLAPLIAFVAVAQLILQPGYLAYSSDLFALLPAQRESLLLQGAAPVATLPAIFCREYNCDAQLAASLILATTLLAIGTVPLAVDWFG